MPTGRLGHAMSSVMIQGRACFQLSWAASHAATLQFQRQREIRSPQNNQAAGRRRSRRQERTGGWPTQLPPLRQRSPATIGQREPASALVARSASGEPKIARQRTISETEDQQRLGKPKRTVDDFLVLPDRTDGRPETVALREVHDRRCERSQDQNECQ